MHEKYTPPKNTKPKPKAKGFDFLDGIYGKRRKASNQNYAKHIQHP